MNSLYFWITVNLFAAILNLLFFLYQGSPLNLVCGIVSALLVIMGVFA